MPFEALAPIIVVAFGFAAYCVGDVVRSPATRYLPKWAWVLICLSSIPIGGIAYLVVGRSDR